MEFFKLGEMNIQSRDVLCDHALGVFREHLIQGQNQTEATPADSGETPPGRRQKDKLPAATDLQYASVTFQKNSTGSLKEITFENGRLTLPYIFMDEQTESKFLNLMALEFQTTETSQPKHVTAYIKFMASLVCSTDDVNLLCSNAIIDSSIESDEEIVALFDKLAKSQPADPADPLNDVRLRLRKHYSKNYWRSKWAFIFEKWRFEFGKTYCNTPWGFIGPVSGIIIMALTAMQAYYGGLPYYGKTKSSMPPPPNSSHH